MWFQKIIKRSLGDLCITVSGRCYYEQSSYLCSVKYLIAIYCTYIITCRQIDSVANWKAKTLFYWDRYQIGHQRVWFISGIYLHTPFFLGHPLLPVVHPESNSRACQCRRSCHLDPVISEHPLYQKFCANPGSNISARSPLLSVTHLIPHRP